MWRPIAVLAVGLVLAVVIFFVGMRTKSPLVRKAVRRFNRAVGNPHAMKTAGMPGAYASVIRHTGRTTGRTYATPVVAHATDDGFVIALPYGPETDWIKNVLASGSATIVAEGHTYRVDRPEIVSTATVVSRFPRKEQGGLRRFAVDRCFRVRQVERDVSSV